MKNHLSEISIQEKNRILEMHKKSTQRHYLVEDKETPTPNTVDSMKELGKFVSLFKNKRVNLYLPDDFSLPIINQFAINDVNFTEDGNSIFLNGNAPGVGDIKLTYKCDGTNIFNVEIRKFENNLLNNIANLLDTGIDTNWKKLLMSFSQGKTRTLQAKPRDVRKETHNIYAKLLSTNPRELVEGGTDKNCIDMIKHIQDFICSINKEGKAVPKADFDSTNKQSNQNMA